MESIPENKILEWKGLKVGEPVENPGHGWSGKLVRLHKHPSGDMIGVRSGGEKHEMEEFAKNLFSID
jgi:hypothetical protein